MQGYLASDPSAPQLDPANCLGLAFPPTPMLQTPPHTNAHRPWVNLGQQVSQLPTRSLTACQSWLPPWTSSQFASQGQTVPVSSAGAASQHLATAVGKAQNVNTAESPSALPLQSLFPSKPKGRNSCSEGQSSQGPAALRFYLLAELWQTAESACWLCYLLTCSCTFRGVVQQVMVLGDNDSELSVYS